MTFRRPDPPEGRISACVENVRSTFAHIVGAKSRTVQFEGGRGVL